MTKAKAQMLLDTLILEDKVEGDDAKAVLMGVKALEAQSRIEQELHGKTAEEQLDFLNWFIKDYSTMFTNTRLALLKWLMADGEPTITTAGEPIFVTGMSIAKGKWSHPKRIHNVKHSTVWQCSICRRTCHCIGGVPRGEANICTYKFCPNCGAEMEISDD